MTLGLTIWSLVFPNLYNLLGENARSSCGIHLCSGSFSRVAQTAWTRMDKNREIFSKDSVIADAEMAQVRLSLRLKSSGAHESTSALPHLHLCTGMAD